MPVFHRQEEIINGHGMQDGDLLSTNNVSESLTTLVKGYKCNCDLTVCDRDDVRLPYDDECGTNQQQEKEYRNENNASSVSVEAKEVEDVTVRFTAGSNCFQLLDDSDFDLCPLRRQEIVNLRTLHNSLGPLVTSIYIDVLLREISRADNDGETVEYFEDMKNFLRSARDNCIEQCNEFGNDGRNDKLLKLEGILKQHASSNDNHRRGIVFVSTRIVAVALFCYLEQKYNCSNSSGRIRSSFLVRRYVVLCMTPS